MKTSVHLFEIVSDAVRVPDGSNEYGHLGSPNVVMQCFEIPNIINSGRPANRSDNLGE